MTRHEKTKWALALVGSKVLTEECEYHMSIDREEPGFDMYDALTDAYDLAVDTNHREIMTPARKALIMLGCWRHVTDEELERVQTLGGKKFDFILGGKKYVWEKHL